MSRVVVMMSTYNGERFLREQIDSIRAQRDVDVTLVIRDDVSHDSTPEIIAEAAQGRDDIVTKPSMERMGPGKSFISMLYQCFDDYGDTADYYAFADQDDVWLPDKLAVAVSALKTLPAGRPGLYCSNQIVYKDGRRCGMRFSEPPNMTLAGHITRNLPSGCTYLLNRELVRAVCEADHADDRIIERRIHDSWMMLVALSIGSVIYDHDSYILYRIHDHNTVGIEKDPWAKVMKVKYRNLTDREFAHYRRRTAAQLLKSFPDISGRNREILEEVAYYTENHELKQRLLKDNEVMAGIGSPLKVILNIV